VFRSPHLYIAVQAIIEFIGNAVLNGAIGWYWTQGFERVPLWGWASAAIDLLGTGFGIGFALTLVFTWRFHRRLRLGTTQPFADYSQRVPGPIQRLPFDPWRRSVLIGLAGAVVAIVPLLLLQLAGMSTLARPDFIMLKTVLAGLIAAGAIAAAGYRALGDGVTPQKPRGYWPDRKIHGV
jgi:hypothetical protein